MRVFDLNSAYNVSVSERYIDRFNRDWPASNWRGLRGGTFQFDKSNGDLNGIMANIQWLSGPLVGAAQVAQGKALLLLWSKLESSTPLLDYGTQTDDLSLQWTTRDGIELQGFSVWRNKSGYTPQLETFMSPAPAQAFLDQAHFDALVLWAQQKGLPLPPAPVGASSAPEPEGWPVGVEWPPPSPSGWPASVPWPPSVTDVLTNAPATWPSEWVWPPQEPSGWPADVPWPLPAPTASQPAPQPGGGVFHPFLSPDRSFRCQRPRRALVEGLFGWGFSWSGVPSRSWS